MNGGGGQIPTRPAIIGAPYLLALNVALVRDGAGRHYADPSWAKDLLLHTEYLPNLTMACPIVRKQPPASYVEIPPDRLRVAGWRSGEGGIAIRLSAVFMTVRLLRELPRSRVVHTGVAGYPVPAGWVAIPLARALGKIVVVPVESAFWRVSGGQTVGWSRRARAAIWESVNRFCLRQADYASYSQPEYRRTLPSPRANGGVLFQASWIDDETILSEADVLARWTDPLADGPARLLFASRMVRDKGTDVLAAVFDILAAADADVCIDLIGTGPERASLEAAAAASEWGRARVRSLEPATYGPAFFELLRRYHAVLLPTLSDEQPRVVYDAYSQGVPAIATDTPGLKACVLDRQTGRTVAAGDPQAFAYAILSLAADRAALRDYGLAGRSLAAQHTHRGLHRERAAAIKRLLDVGAMDGTGS